MRVINKNLFVNTNTFDCIVTVARNGVQIRQKNLETDVEPLHDKIYDLPVRPETAPGEYTVTVSFRLKERRRSGPLPGMKWRSASMYMQ